MNPARAMWDRDSTEEKFRLLVQSVKDYAIFMLSPSGHVASWNEGAERIKGYRAEEIIGEHFSVFYPREDIEARKPERKLEIAIRDGRVEDEGWRLRKDGTRFMANVVITALFDKSGQLRGFAKVTRDMTQHYAAQEALHDLPGKLLAAQEEERRRIARELHDNTSQLITGVIARLHSVRDRVAGVDKETSSTLDYSLALAESVAREIRNIYQRLDPPLLAEAGLVRAILAHASAFSQRNGLVLKTEVPSDVPRMPADVERVLFRIVEESLPAFRGGRNIVMLRLNLYGRTVVLEMVEPALRALEPRTMPRAMGSESQIALAGLAERLRQFDGKLEVNSTSPISVRASVKS